MLGSANHRPHFRVGRVLIRIFRIFSPEFAFFDVEIKCGNQILKYFGHVHHINRLLNQSEKEIGTATAKPAASPAWIARPSARSASKSRGMSNHR